MIRDQYKNVEIKVCPFCGCDANAKKAQELRYKMYYIVCCEGYKCKVMIRAETKGEAIARWNRRSTDNEPTSGNPVSVL